jgi:hypothetical protein
VVAENYGTMLSGGELSGALQPSAARNRSYLVAHLRRHLFTWFGIVIFLLVGLFVAHVCLASVTQVKQPANAPAARADSVTSNESWIFVRHPYAHAERASWPGFDQPESFRPFKGRWPQSDASQLGQAARLRQPR